MRKVILICGDRDWKDYNSILNVVKRLKSKYGDIKIVEGECPGADVLARKAATECEIPHSGYPAQMIDEEKPDLCIAFHPNIEKSKGTKDMVARAKAQGIETYIITK